MTLKAIQHYEAALQRVINKRTSSSGVKVNCDSVAKAPSQKDSSGGKNTSPIVFTSKNKAQLTQILKDGKNS